VDRRFRDVVPSWADVRQKSPSSTGNVNEGLLGIKWVISIEGEYPVTAIEGDWDITAAGIAHGVDKEITAICLDVAVMDGRFVRKNNPLERTGIWKSWIGSHGGRHESSNRCKYS